MEINCDKWFYTVLFLIGLFFVWSLIIFRYYLKVNKKSIELGSADRQQELKNHYNELRINQLEEENGKELREIEALKVEVSTLKGVIETISKNKDKSNI